MNISGAMAPLITPAKVQARAPPVERSLGGELLPCTPADPRAAGTTASFDLLALPTAAQCHAAQLKLTTTYT
jgi:hypothetical protein